MRVLLSEIVLTMAWTADIDSLIDLGSQDCTYQKRAQGIIASGGERLDKQQLFPDSINSTSLNLMVGAIFVPRNRYPTNSHL